MNHPKTTELEYLKDLGELIQQLCICQGRVMRRYHRYRFGVCMIPRHAYAFYIELAGFVEEPPVYGNDSALIQYCRCLKEALMSLESSRHHEMKVSGCGIACSGFIRKYAHGF